MADLPISGADGDQVPEKPHPRLRTFISKQQRDFGRLTQYDHLDPIHLILRNSNPERQNQFVEKIFTDVGTQESTILSTSSTNTEVPITETRSLSFTEGAWPKDIVVTDPEQTTRYRKIIEKEEGYVAFIASAAKDVEEIVKDNNIFDYLDQYFDDDEVDVTFADGFHVKLLAEYHDSTCKFNRKVQDLFFFPEDNAKVAVAYQETGDPDVPYNDATLFGAIWDVNLMYKPIQNFLPPFRLYSIVYNPKETNCLVGSLWTGQLCQWDIRAGEEPIVTTDLEIGHSKICRKIQWLQSKTMTEIVSVGMDGQMIFWDIRKWDEPVERIILDPGRTKAPTPKDGAPCACVDFDQSIPSRLCAGSEKGYIFNINRKSKNAHEKITWVWKDVVTPILSLQRNIAHSRYMLAVSCDDVKIFADDCRDSWIIDVRPTEGHFTAGCWSPTRPGVFVTTSTSGCFATWDLNRGSRCTTPAAWIDVDNKCLTCVAPHGEGRLYGVGCINGTWGITEVSNALYIPTQKEKNDVGELFEREAHREKILEGRGRERLAQIRKEALAKADTIATAMKAGKPPPPTDLEDIIDPAYNLPFRLGPIIPQEQPVKKDLPKDNTVVIARESMKQYEVWVTEEDEEMRHRRLPTMFNWQMEDEGVGTIMAKLADRAHGHVTVPVQMGITSDFASCHPPEQYNLRQLGQEPVAWRAGSETTASLPEDKTVKQRIALPLDFAAETRKRMGADS